MAQDKPGETDPGEELSSSDGIQHVEVSRRTVEDRLRATDELLRQWHAAEESDRDEQNTTTNA
jgi:hypothetical protein